MSPFREKHETTVVAHAGGHYAFECTCGAHSRSGPSRAEAQDKATIHTDTVRAARSR